MARSSFDGRGGARRREAARLVEVGRGAELVEPVRPRGRHQRAVVVLEQRVAGRERAEDRNLRLLVVADGKVIAGGLGRQEPVALPAVEVLDHRLPVVRGILVAARLELVPHREGRRGPAVEVGIGQSGLLAIRAGNPSEQMVERPVLEHEDDNGVERRGLRVREQRRRRARGRPGRRCRAAFRAVRRGTAAAECEPGRARG